MTTVVQALAAVMTDVGSIAKTGRNETQKFNFRGIDAVINAVGPSLRRHGVVVLPIGEELTAETYTTKPRSGSEGTLMRNITLRVRFAFYGPGGDSIEAVTYGEAADAGDKAVSKAHSVAFRTCLLQTLCIPTDEPDPDAQSHERAEPAGHVDDPSVLRGMIARLGKGHHMSPEEIAADFANWSQGEDIRVADVSLLHGYLEQVGKVRA